MKLKTKIMAVSVALLTAAVTVCCVFLLRFAYRNVMNEVTDAGIRDYESFSTKYTARISASGDKTGRVLASYLSYQLGQTDGGREYTLQREDEMLSNAIGLNALATVSNNGSTQYMYEYSEITVRYTVARYEGQTYFIVAGALPNGLSGYTLSLVRNITVQSDALSRLALECVLTCVLVALLTAALLLAVLNFFLKPIGRLKAGASELAQGHYQNRVACSGKDELSELAEDFNSMADAVQASMRELQNKAEQQQEFIDDLSHELKTPVTSILLSSETLLGRSVSKAALERSLERIYSQAKWLEKLSQKLTTLVLLRGEIPLRRENVMDLLLAVRETTADSLQKRGVELDIDCNTDFLEMDFDLMRSALANLVENAKNASEPGQRIILSAYDSCFTVSDSGTGILPEEVARVTEPFYRVDRSRSRLSGGSGLGLTLVKRISEAHGAHLEIVSEPGKGTTVRFLFDQRK